MKSAQNLNKLPKISILDIMENLPLNQYDGLESVNVA